MIRNDPEMQTTLNEFGISRRSWLDFAEVETNPSNYRLGIGVSVRSRPDAT